MTGDARGQLEPAAVKALHLVVLLGDQRARAHQAHLAPEHVEQLRELVQRGSPEQPPRAGDPRIARDLEEPAARLVEVSQLLPAPVGVAVHGPELEHLEGMAVAPDPGLAEEHRAARPELDGHRDQDQEGHGGHEHQGGPEQVEPALHQGRGSAQAEAADAEHDHPVQVVEHHR